MKKKKLIILDTDLAISFVWMSIRYSIGRHTIAAVTHANDIAKFLNDNSEQLMASEDQRLYYATDIRQEITNRIRFRYNVHVEGHNGRIDALTLILHKMVADKVYDFGGFRWCVNMNICDVSYEELPTDERNAKDGWRMDFDDLMSWIRLAGWLDPTERITVESDGKTETRPGFSYFRTNVLGVQEMHQWAENYIKRPYQDTYQTSEHIKEIKINYL